MPTTILGGILATGPFDLGDIIPDTVLSRDIPVRYSVPPSYPRPAGFSRNYSIIQQGFTANVSCSQQDLSESTWPSLNSSSYDLAVRFDSASGEDELLRRVDWTTVCMNGNQSCELAQIHVTSTY